ncbi:di-trans,poly-cis-decaprenylcistransferase [Candidatus Saccharibacteria bacterium]|nr:di-trans,poly-cis-decaprenylcistransferase [Candidatus Saccharibacteria bacterium]
MAKAKSQLNHIAFIVDGNRRWAVERGLSKLDGHKAGYERLKEIALACFDRGIAQVGAYIFSTENWNRQEAEVSYLMNLAYRIFTQDLEELNSKGVRIRFWGFRERLSAKLQQAIDETESKTAKNTAGTLNLCFNYGGQQEIVMAVKEIVDSKISADKVDEEVIKSHLFTHDTPAPDLIVRTSGEQRLSNFLLWDSAYSELNFVPAYWPDFDVAWLDNVIDDFNGRERRYGGGK